MIVSDSTTLIILGDLECFELLSNLFENIIIPSAVFDEISAKKPMELPSFISVQKPKNTEIFSTLKQVLDLGESEAIALALERKSRLIIDEKKGRKIAMQQGIEIIGLLGIIYLNIKKGHLGKTEAKEFLDKAQQHGYRISNILIVEMFKSLGVSV